MKRHHVVTTLNPATAVTCAIKGYFTNTSVKNLIVCKGSTVEIYTIMADGIKLFNKFSIFGVISSIQMCNFSDQQTSSIFLLTEQNCFTVLTFDSKKDCIITEGHGKIDTNARNTDQAIATIFDTKTNTILVSAFTGFLFAIPMSKGNGKSKIKETKYKPSAMRTREYDILSIVSLRGIHISSLAILSGETNELKTIKTFKYKSGTNEVTEVPKLTVKVEATTHTLIAVPDPIGGVLSIGEYIISYHELSTSPGSTKELSIDLVTVSAYTFLENSDQCILGDTEGYLYVLTLETSNMKVVGITSNVIGQSSIPHTMIDLGNGLLYIGSTQGDSSLVRLVPNALRKYTVEPVSTFLNLGPIVDFCLYDYDGHGEQTMVCCSGTDKDGSLRVVENGVGFIENFQLNIPLLNKVWSLGKNTLVVSTALETILLKAIENKPSELTEYQTYSKLVLDQVTLDIAVTFYNHIVQVTSDSIRLVHHHPDGRLIAEWKPPQNQKISIAKVNTRQCVICYGKGTLVYLDITDNALLPKCVKQFPDIACIHLSPKHENGTDHDFVTIGMWSQSVIKILQLPDLNPVLEHTLDSVTGPKDVLLIHLEKIQYLMILLGDGQILTSRITFQDKTAILSDNRQTMVGTYCTAMYPFLHGGEQKIFITGIRPTIVTSWHRKLFFSAVNLKNVYSITPFYGMIVLMTEHNLSFGQTDTSQKLHHTKIKLNDEMPIRIQYSNISKILAVGTIFNQKDINNGFIKQIGKIQILDAQTFHALDTFTLGVYEIVESMTMTTFVAYPNQEFLFVGTAIENQDDPNKNSGRILVFDIKEKKCELLEEVKLPGVIYSLKSFQNSVVACVDGSIFCLKRFQPDLPLGERIEFKSEIHNNTVALRLDTNKDRVLVADLMQSVSVLKMTKEDPLSLKLLAVDNQPAWMTAVKFVNEDVYIGADNKNNVFTLSLDTSRQSSQRSNQSGIMRLELEGGYHIGSLINCFKSGILSDMLSNAPATQQQQQRHDENDLTPLITATESSFTYVTVHGSIGTIKTISENSFHFFQQIQSSILKESNNIGGLDHTAWRSYKSRIHNNTGESNYLDGDLLKSFQLMNTFSKQRVIESLPSSIYKASDIENFIRTLVA